MTAATGFLMNRLKYCYSEGKPFGIDGYPNIR